MNVQLRDRIFIEIIDRYARLNRDTRDHTLQISFQDRYRKYPHLH